MDRITEGMLQKKVDYLNQLTKSPLKPYAPFDNGTSIKANPGNFHIDSAYGGYSLRRMSNDLGGSSDVLNSGYVNRRMLYELIHSYIQGYKLATGRE